MVHGLLSIKNSKEVTKTMFLVFFYYTVADDCYHRFCHFRLILASLMVSVLWWSSADPF